MQTPPSAPHNTTLLMIFPLLQAGEPRVGAAHGLQWLRAPCLGVQACSGAWRGVAKCAFQELAEQTAALADTLTDFFCVLPRQRPDGNQQLGAPGSQIRGEVEHGPPAGPGGGGGTGERRLRQRQRRHPQRWGQETRAGRAGFAQ